MADPIQPIGEVPPFDPSKPHHALPKLRPLQPMQLKHEDRPMLGLRDPARISGRVLLTSPLSQFILGHLDGKSSIDEIAVKAVHQAQAAKIPQQAIDQIQAEPIQTLVSQLDNAGFLEGPVFEDLLKDMQEKFDASDTLPPGATANYADGLVAMEIGEGVTDEQKAEMGPAKMRENFDQFIEKALEKAEKPSLDTLPRAVVAPACEYGRGWQNFAAVFGRLRVVDRPDRVIIVAPNHFGRSPGISGCDKHYETPLGVAKCDTDFVAALQADLGPDLTEKLMAGRFDHENEHSIEMMVPWIQHTLAHPDTGESPKVVGFLVHNPLMANGESYEGRGVSYDQFIAALKKTIARVGGKTLIVAAGDMSHVGPSFGDQQPLSNEDGPGKQFRDKVLLHDRTMVGQFADGKIDEVITQMTWEQNPTRNSLLGPLMVACKVCDADKMEILGYAAAGDAAGASLVSTMAAAIY